MILILTYHKVVRGPEAKPEFYAVRAADLQRHLELLAGSGFHALTPEELLLGKARSEPSYLLSFDDGTRDHHEVVLPLLARHNCRAVFFVPTSKLDRAGYLGQEALREMHRQGQTIGLHGHEHQRMDRLPDEQMRHQMQLSRQALEKLTGEQPAFFAPPGGFINARLRRLALEAGVRAIRTMRWGYNPHPDLTSLECAPVNRNTTEGEFRKILQFQNRPLVYAMKELTKKLVPGWVYESLRNGLFGRPKRR